VVRNVYIGEDAGKWINLRLKSLESDGFFHGVERPREQLADIFRRVMINEPIDSFRPKTLIEHPDWLHELRTPDLRVFGWFWRQRDFIASAIATKADLRANKIAYSGCLEQCRAHRTNLDLDPPKFIEGDINDILRI